MRAFKVCPPECLRRAAESLFRQLASTARPDGIRGAGEIEGPFEKGGCFDEDMYGVRYISFIAQTTSSLESEISWRRAPIATTTDVPWSDDDERLPTLT